MVALYPGGHKGPLLYYVMQNNHVKWRLIDTGPLDGPANMAIDEALLNNFDPETSAPVLRLYGWSPPALSLGRFQKATEVLDLERCVAENVSVVRRITGGGVIYHCEELTYSIVCAPHQLPPAATVKESFRVLTSFLRSFYGRLGLDARYAIDCFSGGERLGERTAFCFAGRESYDILVGGRKIGGNAQRRLRNVIFQHGSIPLVNCAVHGAGFLREPPVGVGKVTGALHDFGVGLAQGELKRLMAEAFMEALSAVLVEGSLTEGEETTVASIGADRHSCPSWVWEGVHGKNHEDYPQA
ncbi:MAG: lipoate-protein ligase [Geobacteraceae bacterium]|nr:MAG: lipoate-protein ligase [Geobacteraceae bacterium]